MQSLCKGKNTASVCQTMFNLANRHLHTKFAIVGGGTTGMNVAGQLLSSKTATPSEITVFEPRRTHYYQPGFTLVSGGVLGEGDVRNQFGGLVRKPMHHVFNPMAINYVADSIGEYDPDNSRLYTAHSNQEYTYDILIMGTGIELRYDLIEGLQEALDDPESPVGSSYKLKYALKMNKLRSKFQGGTVIGTQPPAPFKCGGQPQKWVYLTDYRFRQMGIRDDVEFKFATPLPGMFGVKKYNKELLKLVAQKNVTPMHQTQLVKVESDKRVAWFQNNVTKEVFCESYDLLHAVPPQRSNKVTAAAAFSDADGFVDVNKYTLQSTRYANVFGVGDCNNSPTPKTAASIFASTPTVIDNINHVLKKEKVIPSFDGYASCPIFVDGQKVMLAEFIYDGVPKETFRYIGLDQGTPRRAFYYLKRYMFPLAYWNFAPRGMWYGTTCVIRPWLKPVVDIDASQIVKPEPKEFIKAFE